MTFNRTFTLLGTFALLTGLNGSPQRPQGQATVSFGTAAISLGMTFEQVAQNLTEASRHTKPINGNKDNVSVYASAGDTDYEGQIAFRHGRVMYADYQMPVTNSADDLAQEIAGAVADIETKTCTASNYTGHGTGGGMTQSIFECGSKNFFVMTVQTLGSTARPVNVHIQIGEMVAD